jgi:hypothetical protein
MAAPRTRDDEAARSVGYGSVTDVGRRALPPRLALGVWREFGDDVGGGLSIDDGVDGFPGV